MEASLKSRKEKNFYRNRPLLYRRMTYRKKTAQRLLCLWQISEGKDEDVSDLQTAVNMQTEVENVSENENLSEKRVDENAQLYAQADVKAADDRIVQQGQQTEMPVTQETPESPEEMFQTLPKEIFTRISAGEKEFTVQLEPENLGS